MASSRATTTTAIQAGSHSRPTNAMKAVQTMILSASGSMRMPKLVISLRRRASSPSRKSLTPATRNSARAMVSRNGMRENITTRNATVSRKRETVSLFGRFIPALFIAKPPWRKGFLSRLRDQIVIRAPHDPHPGKLAGRQRRFTRAGGGADVHTPVDVRRVGFAAGDQMDLRFEI